MYGVTQIGTPVCPKRLCFVSIKLFLRQRGHSIKQHLRPVSSISRQQQISAGDRLGLRLGNIRRSIYIGVSYVVGYIYNTVYLLGRNGIIVQNRTLYAGILQSTVTVSAPHVH